MSRRALAKKEVIESTRSPLTAKRKNKTPAVTKRSSELKRKVLAVQSSKGNLTQKEKANTILSHMDSAVRIGWSLLNRWRIRLPQDEVQSIAGMALCEAANRFNKKLGVSFRTFFFYHLRGLLLREISRRISEQKLQSPVDTHDPALQMLHGSFDVDWPSSLVEHDNPERLFVRGELSRICWDACSDLDELERDVILRFFIEEQNVSDIAKDLGYCRCHISRVKSRALAQVSKRLRSSIVDEEGIESEGGLTLAMRISQVASGYRGGRGRRKVGNGE